MKTMKFGVIGCGLMGKEFASATLRWNHLAEEITKPEIIGVCDTNPVSFEWFDKGLPNIKHHFTDYRELLACEDIEGIYCAVPHVMHQQVYGDIINSGKHLMGEKPFGMDKAQNDVILEALKNHPAVFCRCASEFPFFPACQQVIEWINEGKLGQIIEVKSAFNHASDLDPEKPINWKRRNAVNGEYGCMGDLGLHIQHIPFAMGWFPDSVYAVLSNIVKERPDGKGGMSECDTWDNATMLCRVKHKDGYEFPMTLETKRIEPGATNQWYLKVNGTKASVYFTSEDPNAFHFLYSEGKTQAWSRVIGGYQPMFKTITGDIFEFGFSDSILQMWAAYMAEMDGRKLAFVCVRPEHTQMSHALMTAALKSYKEQRVVNITETSSENEISQYYNLT